MNCNGRQVAGALLASLALLAGAASAKDPAPPVAVRTTGESVLKGRVIDEAGAPVASADVRAWFDADLVRLGADLAGAAEPVVPDARGHATSGPDGAFQVAGLATAAYVVRVEAPGHGLGVFRGVVAAPGGGPPAELSVPAGYAVEGDVVDTAGKGIADAAVSARFFVDDDAHPEHPVAGRVVARADAAGHFRLEGVPVSAGGDAVKNLMLTARASGGAATALHFAGPRPAGRVTLVLAGGGALDGTVRDAKTQAPLVGARVQALVGGEGDASRSLVVSAVTGADGSWRAAGLPPGPVQFVTVAAPHAGATGGPPGAPASVRDGEAAHVAVDVVTGRSVSGEAVAGPDGARLSGVEVLAWARGAGFAAATTTDAQGKYEIDGLPWGDAAGKEPVAVLVLGAPGWVPRDERDLVLRLSRRSGPALRGSLPLVRAAAVAGRVVDGAGQPVPDAVVAVVRTDAGHPMPGPWPCVVRTGRDGSFLVPDLMPEPYRLTAVSRRVAGTAEAAVRATAGGETTSGVELRFAATAAAGATPAK